MDASCEKTRPVWDRDKPLGLKTKILQIALLVPFFIPFFIAPHIGLLVLFLAGCVVSTQPGMRVHGILLVSGLVYMLLGAYLAHQKFFWLVAYAEVLKGLGFLILPLVPEFVPLLILVLAYLWGILLTPFVLAETVYWLWHGKSVWRPVGVALLIVLVGIPAVRYSQVCTSRYEAVQAYRGQTLPVTTLFERVGPPVFKTSQTGPSDKRPHWVYTNGDWAVPVTVDESGMATVHDMAYIFFD